MKAEWTTVRYSRPFFESAGANRFLLAVVLSALFSSGLQAHVTLEAFKIFEPRCTACHRIFDRNDKAPPLVAVHQVYLRLNDNNIGRAFAAARSFLVAPEHKKALMKPALKLYGLMPKMDMNASEADEYAHALVEIEFEISDWFEEHYRSHKLGRPHRDGFRIP